MSENNYDLVVDVVITKELSTLTKASYGTACLFASTTPQSSFGANRTKLYSAGSIADIGKDFGSSSDEYKRAQAYFSQEPKPTKLRISKRDAAVATVKELAFDGSLVLNNKINGSINGYEVSETIFNSSDSDTLTALAGKIALIPGVASATAGSHKIVITATVNYSLDVSGWEVTDGVSRPATSVNITTPGYSIADDIDKAIKEVDDWYGFLMTSTNAGDIVTAARRINAEKKMGSVVSSTSGIKDVAVTTDIANTLKTGGFNRTYISYHQSPGQGIDAASMGQQFAYDPGKSMWALKTYSGIDISSLNRGEIEAIAAKNCNYYISIGGSGTFLEGVMADGSSIEITRDVDYTTSEVTVGVFGLLKRFPKIPYSKPGIDSVMGQIEKDLNRIKSEGVIVSYQVFPPLLSEISDSDRLAHILPNCRFQAVIALGIKKVLVRGTMV